MTWFGVVLVLLKRVSHGHPLTLLRTLAILPSHAVDIESISTRLQQSAVVGLVGDMQNLDQVINNIGHFKIACKHFPAVEAFEAGIGSLPCSELGGDDRWLCLIIQEDLVNDAIHRILTNHANKSTLLTFGPKHSVKEAQGHYRCLDQIFPTVLIRLLGEHFYAASSSRSHGNEDENGEQQQQQLEKCRAPTTVGFGYSELRILIAEDNLVNQKVLGSILDRLGVKRVEIVNNGKKAVDREAAEPFDLVLMDVQMPIMDGVEACKCISARRQSSNPSHPVAMVVFVTAQVSVDFEAECYKAGASDFLSKPCHIQGVGECLKKLFGE